MGNKCSAKLGKPPKLFKKKVVVFCKSDFKITKQIFSDDQSGPQTSGGQPFAAVRTSIKGPAPPIPTSSSAATNKAEKVQLLIFLLS